jgi:hypothetical protein
MEFIADPKNLRRVFAPGTAYALVSISRDVPTDQVWFDFYIDDTRFEVRSRFAWSNGGKNCTCAMQVQELETRLQYAWSPHGPAYRPSPAEFRTVLLPALRDAIVAWHLRRSGDPRIPKDPSTFVVEFIDQAADDRSTSP